MKKCLLIFFIVMACTVYAKEYTVQSPDSLVKVIIQTDKNICYSVMYKDEDLTSPSSISLKTRDKKLPPDNPAVIDSPKSEVSNTVKPVVGVKSSEIIDHYNELKLHF